VTRAFEPLSSFQVRTARLCPFAAEPLLWRNHDGAWTLTVCARGTFTLAQGREATLAKDQEPIVADRHHDGDPRASLWAASEIVPYKPRVDVVLIGSAFAPGGAPVDALVARLHVGTVDKAVGVVGDRAWIDGPDGLEPGAPVPFSSRPLRGERASRARENPVGFDLARPPALGALAAPNLEAVDDAPFSDGAASFGPVLPTAPSRSALVGPEGFAWATGGLRGPAPRGFDFAFFNAAPRDQQLPLLPERATLILEHLHRDHARLEVQLPTLRPRAFVLDRADRAVEITLRCDTIWIDTDRALLALSWRGLIAADPAHETLAIAADTPDAPLRDIDLIRMLRERAGPIIDDETTTTTTLERLPLDPLTEETTTSLDRRF
jgi:hypothetical protein